jgi:class 3 adenylate cyclase/tetratricopeptide (TPR) repeat protein
MSLRRHIPDLAIEWAVQRPQERWRRVPGALVFADISGFTALAERLAQRGRAGGEELVETLSRVFAAMIGIAHAHGGMLLKFGGDALLLFFDGDDHTRRAAGAAVEMRRELRAAAKIATSVGPLKLSMSVGVHAGDIPFFLVGATHRELVVLGEDATAVIETEAAAESGEILLSASAAREMPHDSVAPRDDGRFLLELRRSPFRAQTPRPRVEAPDDVIASLFPRALGDYLAVRPEPQHRVACIAFMRFSGTDAFLRARGPAALAAALDETVSTVQAALGHEGVSLLAIDIDKDGGKFFLGAGVPYATEDDEGVMLRAMQRIVEKPTALPLQIGVNRGHVFVAEVGAATRAAYSAMGDTTNTAARICSKAPAGCIYAHPAVLDQSLTLFRVEPAGPFTFKGKKAPMLVYEIGTEIGPRRREGLETEQFIGRAEDLAAVTDAVTAVAHGQGGIVTVAADSGLGKSRLLREATKSVAPANFVSMRAEPYGAGSPYRLFRDPLRDLFGIRRSTPQQMADDLTSIVVKAAPQVSPLLSLIGDALHIDCEPSDTVNAIQPNFRAEQRAIALIAVIDALHPEPLVITLDDAQWADEASAELLSALARACTDRPWLMLVARRAVEGGFSPKVGRTLTLAPLEDGAMRTLIESASEAAPLRPHDCAEIVRRAGGNPLFAMEILRAAREVGSVDAVPASLEAAIAAQVDALDSSARRVLRYATLLGRSFSRHVLRDLLDADGAADDFVAVERLDEFLEPDGDDRFRFRNGLVRDTIYGSIAYRARRRMHRIAGEIIERAAADPAASADSLALHFARADDSLRAWRYARLAAERALRTYANSDAARFFEMALTAARSLPDLALRECVQVWTALGDARERAGLFDASLDAYRHALAIVGDDPVARADLLFGRARAKERAGKFSSALRDLTRGVTLIGQDTSEPAAKTRARLSSFAAMVMWGQDRPRRALEQARLAREHARIANEKLSLGRALIVLDLARIPLEGPGNGEHLQEALALFEELGDVRMQAGTRNNLGFLNAVACRWDEAVRWLESGRELYVRSGDVVGGAYTALNTVEILVNQRRYDEAESVLNDALRILRASDFTEYVAAAEIQFARILVARDRVAEADALLQRVIGELKRIGKLMYVLEATAVRADARLSAGDASGALSLIDRAEALAGKDAQMLRPKTAWIRGRAYQALGRHSDAIAEIDEGIDAARAHQLPYDEALLLDARAALDVTRTQDARRSAEILAGLGVRNTPRPSRVV